MYEKLKKSNDYFQDDLNYTDATLRTTSGNIVAIGSKIKCDVIKNHAF